MKVKINSVYITQALLTSRARFIVIRAPEKYSVGKRKFFSDDQAFL